MPTEQVRTPPPSPSVRELLVEVGDVGISGLVAEPESEPRALLVAIHGAGSGIRYARPWASGPGQTEEGDRGAAWGPAELYPPTTFRPGALPLAPMPKAQSAEGGRWPDDLRAFGARIRVPVRFTFGDH